VEKRVSDPGLGEIFCKRSIGEEIRGTKVKRSGLSAESRSEPTEAQKTIVKTEGCVDLGKE